MILLPLHIAAWVLRILAVLPLWVLGFPVCYVLARREMWSLQTSRFFKEDSGQPRKRPQWRPRWAWIWGNEEDGVAGPRWHLQGAPSWRRAFVWSAQRNPVNNARFVFPLGIRIEPRRIRFRSNCLYSPQDDWTGARALWSYTWQGLFSGLWIRTTPFPWFRVALTWRRVWRISLPTSFQFTRRRVYANVRAGWKLVPKDAFGIPSTDYRSKGCGFGLQLQLRETNG